MFYHPRASVDIGSNVEGSFLGVDTLWYWSMDTSDTRRAAKAGLLECTLVPAQI